ncbi:MAG: hypothetical protein V4627_02125 [Pseudomonadota bacterium]
MLEHHANQASGLLGLGCQSGPRLIAMVSHGDERAELPLLWQLCLSLVNFGYSITVLDATMAESEANPGLEQLLGNTHWRDAAVHDTPAWAVIPSAIGIETLSAAHSDNSRSLDQLCHLLPPEGVVVLYCKVEWMTPLISDWHMEPLLAVSPLKSSLLTSYMALKRMLITGTLKPTIINMMHDANLRPSPSALSPSAGLDACARRFLGYDCKTLNIREQVGGSEPCAEVKSLALRLLENSVTLGTQPASRGTGRRLHPVRYFDQFAEGH